MNHSMNKLSSFVKQVVVDFRDDRAWAKKQRKEKELVTRLKLAHIINFNTGNTSLIGNRDRVKRDRVVIDLLPIL